MIEDINNKRKKNLNLDDEESQKLGEIKIKDHKFYFIPNKNKDDLNDFNGEELFAWMIFKGNKFPLNQNKYRLKEGDIIKLGRLWLIVRVIHIPNKKEKEKEKRFQIKDTDCIMVSYHNQGNQSLNIKDDFKDDNKLYANLIDNSDDNDESSDSEKKKKNKNKINIIDDKKEKEKGKEKKNNSQKICRICYLEEDDPNLNPLIRPCKCSGSMKYIHLKCLIFWIKTKIEIDNSEYLDNGKYSIYSYEQIECELCKEIFPDYLKHNNRLYNLMDLEQNFGEEKDNENNNIIITEGESNKKEKNKKKSDEEKSQTRGGGKKKSEVPYIVFDSISYEKNSPSYRYIAKFTNNELKIGRGIDMDLIMNDLSISRNHCHLELNENGEVLLNDSNSKFGTLLLVQAKKIEILEKQTLTIQVGRTFFNILYKKHNSLFSCCHAEEIDLTKSYEKMNYKAVKYNKYCHILTEVDNDEEEVNEEPNKENKENKENKIIKESKNKPKTLFCLLKYSYDNKNKSEKSSRGKIKINYQNNKEKRLDKNKIPKNIYNHLMKESSPVSTTF